MPVLEGPLPSGHYHRVRIQATTVGVYATQPTAITDSVIVAPVCVVSSGRGLTLRGNRLDCEVCVEFTEGVLADLDIRDNEGRCRGSNRPDVLGW